MAKPLIRETLGIFFLLVLFVPILSASKLQGLPKDSVEEILSKSNDTWSSLLLRAYEKSDLKPRFAFPLFVLANPSFDWRESKSEQLLVAGRSFLVPKKSIIGDPRSFLKEVQEELLLDYRKALASADFEAIRRRIEFLLEVLLPLFPKLMDRERSQLLFDLKTIDTCQSLNDDLFLLRNQAPHDLLLASRVKKRLLRLGKVFLRALGNPRLILSEGLQIRLRDYRKCFYLHLEEEALRQVSEARRSFLSSEIERGRQCLLSFLDQYLPLSDGIWSGECQREIRALFKRAFSKLVAPHTLERSLVFSKELNRIVSLLEKTGGVDNYKMGSKISDREFLLLSRFEIPLVQTDCSGFVGRVYRELARAASWPLKGFVVNSEGEMSSRAIIARGVSKKVPISKEKELQARLKQGDILYFELEVKGERDRHVCIFDRLVKRDCPRYFFWEASPGGVKSRFRSAAWLMRRLRDPYGHPRNGVYRLIHMNSIAEKLEKS